MKKIYFTICIMLFSAFSFAQWTWQNPLPAGVILYSNYFTDVNTGYAVGEGGNIIKTTDGGVTWTSKNSGTSNTLKSIIFVNSTLGYAVGDSGTICKTTDGGTTWTHSNITTNSLNSVYFTDANTGYTVGLNNTIFKTTNGGTSWNAQTCGTQYITYNLNSVYFLNASIGYAVGGWGCILKTTNGGTSWVKLSYSSTSVLTSVYFNNVDTGYVIGTGGTIIKTTDGGSYWVTQTAPSAYLNSVKFIDLDTGYVAGDDGIILKTINGGSNWITLTSGTSDDLQSVFISNASTACIVGANHSLNNTCVLTTDNYGANWTNHASNASLSDLYSIDFPTPSIGYAVGNNTILKTTNGGSNWTKLGIDLMNNPLKSVYFTSADTGYVVGGTGALKTDNGGITWSALSGFTGYLDCVLFTDANTGYITDDFGHIYKTINGGTTWISQYSGASSYLFSIAFPSSTTGYIVGMSGKILKTTNGGTTWVAQTSGTTADLNGIYFIDENTGYAVGGVSNYISTILKTTNGGATWVSQTSCVTNCLYSVYFTNANTGYISGYNGTILNTTDGGNNWHPQISNSVNNLHSITFTDSITGYVAGYRGNILTTANGGCQFPGQPNTIAGTTTVCQGQNAVTYTVPAITNVTSYIWTIPSGATGTSTTNSITINYGTSAVSGNIMVKGHNTCGDGVASTLQITVNSLPLAADTISGTAAICQGQNAVTYTVPSIANATSYVWTLPSGATGNSSTNSMTVDYGISALSGNITVNGRNSCGDGVVAFKAITINPIPATPVITNSGNNILHSDVTTGNQWYNQNGIINGATSQNYPATENGSYYVIATSFNCSSDMSNSIQILNTGITEAKINSSITLYPNPTKNQINITIASNLINSDYSISDQLGRKVLTGKLTAETMIVELGNLPNGIYIFRVGEKIQQTFNVVKD